MHKHQLLHEIKYRGNIHLAEFLGNQMGQKLDIGGKQGKDNNLDPSERIKKLKDMLDKGLITEKKFNKKREEILKEL